MAANAEASAVGSLQPPTGSQPRTAAPSLPQATPITLAATLACTTLSPDSAHTPSPVPIATTSSLLPPPLPLSFQPLCPHALPCPDAPDCPLIHFVKALRPHTMEGLGDCSYLNSCHRMESCRYVHYRLEDPGVGCGKKVGSQVNGTGTGGSKGKTLPPQWINGDLRNLDVSVLGKFDVVVADPPWAIHQELPYGTLTDLEMLQMPIGSMQDEGGLLFLWVTGRAMELGRECLVAWGYERIDELVWVKTNQLQGLIRTGRTGHWLNHSKEHCLVAIRLGPSGSSPSLPSWLNKGIDTQVIMAEVRETSRKPDELYGIIERILESRGGARKVELFGREHNLRDGWLTLGNQFGGKDQVFEEELVERFNVRYPERTMEVAIP